MRKYNLIIAIALTTLFLAASIPAVFAARAPGPVIVADLSHGENPAGLASMIRMFPEGEWYILVATSDDVESLPPELVNLVGEDHILVGGFAGEDFTNLMESIDMIIIGQPTVVFSDEEIDNIVAWWTADHKDQRAIWLAADSDYPAQGGSQEIAMTANNAILEALGASLRHDYVSVEDHESYAGKTYRVVGLVQPDDPVKFLSYGAQKVLFHGPGVVAWVDDQGNWHSLTDSKPDNVYRIVWTSDQGTIVEHQAPPDGNLGMAYHVGDEGRFVMLAAEVVNGKDVIIVSGESPYGGYQPGITYTYYGVKLDGPRFVRNMLLWATGVMGELKTYVDVDAIKSEVLNSVQSTISSIQGKVSSVENTVNSLSNNLNDLQNTVQGLQSDVHDALDKADSAKSTASTANTLAIVAIILSLVAIAIPFVKK